ncbi:lysophospholipid acyltransferase family protein [Bacillus sp. REN16]|uniref:lysophospholipid acyltransferase family protein n=1 Tax=Bacillus sp. REN16 TaxID=2887296 RepID=UPI001E4A4016|nr:lysophospholipid acyltransferase family protein [Bacillus sp. REN16]MCC3358304.1 1-acyl-sn-glycerol-3-phosphate acyltransferase [Bacillus sp. REN16]
MNLYPFGRGLIGAIIKPLYRIEVLGRENIPKEGGVLICSNHIDNLDPPVVGVTSPRPIHFMAKAELFKVPVLGWILPNVNAFPVKRGVSDRDSLRTALKILKEGKVLGIFPEGTRSKDGQLGKGLSGVGFFALRTDCVVVPCAIIGPYKAFGKLRVVYGKPVPMETFRNEKASADVVTEKIMDSIREILEKYQ